MGATTTVANQILDKEFRGTDYTPPANRYVSFHTAAPGDTGTNEATGYTRPGNIPFAAAASGEISNTSDFEVTGLAAATYTHFCIQTATTGAAVRWKGTITGGAVASGNVLRIKAGQLKITMDTGNA